MESRTWWAERAPIAASVLMEFGSIGQLWQMWHEHSSLGQNPWSWLAVLLALLLYVWHYRVCAPQLVWCLRAAWLSCGVVSAVFLTVLHFR